MDTMVSYYSVRLSHSITTSVTKKISDIGEEKLSYIPMTCEQLRKQAHHIDPDILQSILKTKTTLSLLQEFLNLHEHLGHIPFAVLFCVCSINQSNHKCLALQDQSLLCPSFIFAVAKRRKWRHGKLAAGTIRN